MRIGFFGDVHGKFDIFRDMISYSSENRNISAAFQAGDFGFSKEIPKHPQLFDLPVPTYIIDGNHEDFRFIKNSFYGDVMKNWSENNLHYQQRGSSADIGGIRVGFIGGALHVHQPQLRKAGNVITNDDVNQALHDFSTNPPDIIVSHSCPAGIGIGIHGHASHAWGVVNHIIMAGYNPGPPFDSGEMQLSHLWERLANRPRLWIFGHFHQFHQRIIGNTHFICLPRLDIYRQSVVWDSNTGEIELI